MPLRLPSLPRNEPLLRKIHVASRPKLTRLRGLRPGNSVLVPGRVWLVLKQAGGIDADAAVGTTFFRLFSPCAFAGGPLGFVPVDIHDPEVGKS
jgi:hypothetical protein